MLKAKWALLAVIVLWPLHAMAVDMGPDEAAKRNPGELGRLLGLDKNQNCIGTRAFYSGRDPKTGDMYFSVRCSDGRDLMATLQAPGNTVRVSDCKVLDAARRAAGKTTPSCFVFLEGAVP